MKEKQESEPKRCSLCLGLGRSTSGFCAACGGKGWVSNISYRVYKKPVWRRGNPTRKYGQIKEGNKQVGAKEYSQ